MSYHPRAYLLALALPLLMLLYVLILAHLTPNIDNPYTTYLEYSSAQIRNLAACYNNEGMGYDTGTYCTLPDVGQSYIMYSFLSNGELSSVSFWRFSEVVLVGDFYAWIGVPLSIRSTKYWTSTTFETDEYFIYISARHNTLYSPVRYVWVRVR